MNNIQQQNEYMQTLKSIPDLLEECFFANGIEETFPRAGNYCRLLSDAESITGRKIFRD